MERYIEKKFCESSSNLVIFLNHTSKEPIGDPEGSDSLVCAQRAAHSALCDSRSALAGPPLGAAADKEYLLRLIQHLSRLHYVDALGSCLMGKHFHPVTRKPFRGGAGKVPTRVLSHRK